jgi:hypothetical protein
VDIHNTTASKAHECRLTDGLFRQGKSFVEKALDNSIGWELANGHVVAFFCAATVLLDS